MSSDNFLKKLDVGNYIRIDIRKKQDKVTRYNKKNC